MNTYELKMAWRKFIERALPSLWVTITFRKTTSRNVAIKSFKRFFKLLNRPRRIYYKKFILCWVYFENKVKGDGYHVHAFVKGIDPLLASILEKECNEAFGSSKVKPYDHSRLIYPASEYVAGKCIVNSDNLIYFVINSKFRGSSNNQIEKDKVELVS